MYKRIVSISQSLRYKSHSFKFILFSFQFIVDRNKRINRFFRGYFLKKYYIILNSSPKYFSHFSLSGLKGVSTYFFSNYSQLIFLNHGCFIIYSLVILWSGSFCNIYVTISLQSSDIYIFSLNYNFFNVIS